LMEDGMTEEEAILAVAEPPTKTGDEVDDSDSNNNENNPFLLKKCSIRIKKVSYIEQALKAGCQTILVTHVNRIQRVRFIYD